MNIGRNVEINMFGQELNPQTYSICKSDFLITNDQLKRLAFLGEGGEPVG